MELLTGALSWWKCHWTDSQGISPWTPLKPQHSIPCWLSVQWEPSESRSCQCCQKKGIIKSLWVDLLCLAFLGLGEPACFHWELCLLVSGSKQSIQLSSQVTRASRTVGSELISSTISLLSWQRLSFWSSLSTLGKTLRKSSASSVPRE